MSEDRTMHSKETEGFQLLTFLKEVRLEMSRVSWSTKRELVIYTAVVAIAVAIVCFLIWISDTIFARLFHIILQ